MATGSSSMSAAAREDFEVDQVDLFDKGSLLRWIEWADIGLLSFDWLCRAPLDVIKNRRQELPPEAFVPASELRYREIFVLSYGWSDPANPDPEGLYAGTLKWFFQSPFGREIISEGAVLFWDHKSLYQHRLCPDWDGQRDTFAQNLIKGRTPAEDVKFRRAMSGMQALYFHAETVVLVAQAVPEGGRNPRLYEDRGWTAMECAGACLSGATVALENLDGDWDPDFQKALVPMSLADFETEVARRFFFREEDRAEVVRMYRDGFAAYARASEQMEVDLGGSSWAGVLEKAAKLARALPEFERLRDLDLHGYPFSWEEYLNMRARGDPAPDTERSPELDGVLDALARRGCEVRNGRKWDPDGGVEDADGKPNPAHNPPRRPSQ